MPWISSAYVTSSFKEINALMYTLIATDIIIVFAFGLEGSPSELFMNNEMMSLVLPSALYVTREKLMVSASQRDERL